MIEFRKVNITDDIDTCIEFRKDSYVSSFPDSDDWKDHWDEKQYVSWLKKHITEFPDGVWHIWNDTEIIGQLEFAYLGENGHVNLYYLTAANRGKGYSGALQKHVVSVLRKKGCLFAFLRVSPTNKRARNYYEKHRWQDCGIDEKHNYVRLYKLNL